MTSQHHDRREDASALPLFLIGLLVVYVSGFAAIILDEFVFQTFVIHSHLPEWASEVLAVVYWPLILLWGMLG